METSSEKKKINTKQKTRVRTHSWDEKKFQNMIDGEDAKNKRFTKRYVEIS